MVQAFPTTQLWEKMKWEQDLIKDIRTHTLYDDLCDDDENRIPRDNAHLWPWAEVTEANRNALNERFLRVRDNCPAILEIGVCRNGENSHTHIFLKNKNPDTIYVGIDLDDKSFLDRKDQKIFTIKNNSTNVNLNFKKMQEEFGVTQFGFIFIDGNHSINQVLADWEYTQWLMPGGIVGFHDTTHHPGPHYFVKNLNRDIWEVEENVCPNDFGIGFCWRK